MKKPEAYVRITDELIETGDNLGYWHRYYIKKCRFGNGKDCPKIPAVSLKLIFEIANAINEKGYTVRFVNESSWELNPNTYLLELEK